MNQLRVMNYDLSLPAISAVDLGIVILDQEKRIIFANDWFLDAADHTHDNILDIHIEDAFVEKLGARLMSAIDKCLTRKRSSLLSQKLNKHPFPLYRDDPESKEKIKTSQIIYVKPLENRQHESYCLIEIFDVTEAVLREKTLNELSRKNEEALRKQLQEEEKFKAIFECAKDAIITLNGDGVVLDANIAAANILGYAPERLLECNVLELISVGSDVSSMAQVLKWANTNQVIEINAVRSDGKEFPIELTINKLELADEQQFVVIVRDISEKRKVQEQLEYLAKFDNLTGVANRFHLNESFEKLKTDVGETDSTFYVLYIDVDRFKSYNESLGHSVGDEIIIETARRLKASLRDSDLIARISADDFVAIINEPYHEERAQLHINKIFSEISRPYNLLDHVLNLTVSIGLVTFPENGETIEALLTNAEASLETHRDKQSNSWSTISDELNRAIKSRLSIESDLREAIGKGQFELFFQPKVEAREHRIVGAEALIRWQHPHRGLVPPFEFIEIAEQSGLIIPIGDEVIAMACQFQNKVKALGHNGFVTALNLSPKQFANPKLMTNLIESCQSNEIFPSDLELEITESDIMENIDESIALVNKLSRAGFKIAIDDFGTGYSSLSYLRNFSLDTLKIDRAFVMDLPDSADAVAVTNTILSLSSSLNFSVVAEGVENNEQAAFLKDNNCDYLQGYYFSKPLPESEFFEWLRINSDGLAQQE